MTSRFHPPSSRRCVSHSSGPPAMVEKGAIMWWRSHERPASRRCAQWNCAVRRGALTCFHRLTVAKSAAPRRPSAHRSPRRVAPRAGGDSTEPAEVQASRKGASLFAPLNRRPKEDGGRKATAVSASRTAGGDSRVVRDSCCLSRFMEPPGTRQSSARTARRPDIAGPSLMLAPLAAARLLLGAGRSPACASLRAAPLTGVG